MPRILPRVIDLALIALLTAATLAASGASAVAGEFRLAVGGVSVSVPVESVRERLWRTVVRQERDYSCGAAAVATLLTYHYGRETRERDVFDEMFATGDQDKITRQGFSLLDMKRYLESRGFVADGFKVSLDQFANAGIPAIVIVVIRGYRHFVVVKGVTDSAVLVGDPALGLKEYARDEFEALLASDIVFAVRNFVPTGRENFNQVAEWAANPPAPFGEATTDTALGSFLLSLPSPDGLMRSR